MASFRLKLRSTEIDLPNGELTIGRGTDCFLRIDDELVSRRHAKLIVTPLGVAIEDLGSRNGSTVNSNRLNGSMELKIGDVVEIGTQTFQLLKGAEAFRPTVTMMPHLPCPGCQRIVAATEMNCPNCGTSLQKTPAAALPGVSRPPFVANEVSRNPSLGASSPVADSASHPAAVADTAQPKPASSAASAAASGFQLIAGLVDKLMTLGRVEEAERMLAPRLRELLTQAQAGGTFPASAIDGALSRAVRLASSTAKDEWYRWIFDFARATKKRLDDRTVDELHANMMAHKPAAAEAVMFYFSLHDKEDAETILHRKRLEALLRYCRD